MGTYAERRPAGDLAGHLRCTWTALTGAPAAVLPDGCLDLMWIGGELVVAGPDTGPVPNRLPPGTPIAAVRFRPGAAPAVLGLPAAELRDRRVPLADLWPGGQQLRDQLGDATGASARVALLEAAVRGRLADAPPVDPVALAVADRLAGGPAARLVQPASRAGPGGRAPGARSEAVVTGLAGWVGLSERQLHRRCLAAFGYGAKTLDRVLRLQRFLALGRAAPRPGLAALAVAAGYADQAHLAHDCRALAGAVPSDLLR